MFKRCFDVFGAGMAIFFLFPVIIIVWVANLIFLGCPAFFTQIRVGKDERLFKLIKFRSMEILTDSKGDLLSDQARLGVYGAWLRKYSLDELPTLINVLKGDMSLVGPRPLLPEYLNFYTDEQKRRHHVKPGITGWAQVCGRNSLNWEEKFLRDVWYVDHQTVILDCKILLKTFIKVFSASDVNHPDHATMPRLDRSHE